MPFENAGPAPQRIAVIGAGISGMGAAYMLAPHHHVTLYEAEPRLGGHARTRIAGKRGDQPVDTGFIVFNEPNYPHLNALFRALEVPIALSDMSFGASIDGGRIEYGLRNLGAIFAQRRNLARPGFLRMMRDVVRFNARAESVAQDPAITIGEMMERLGTGRWFRDYYLTPLSGAIWSTPVERIAAFPAKAMIDFFRNHALLRATGQHQWYTVQGGSIEYVRRLETAMRARGVEIRTGCPVEAVRRPAAGAEVRARGAWEHFDAVVMAGHSDDSLALLTDADDGERRDLGAIAYQPNEVVLHADPAVMPRRRACWSSWNYTEERGKQSDRIDITYWMNSLQPIPKDDPLFVTLNATRPIREELIHDIATLRHPVYTLEALAAQARIRVTNGRRDTWFCGAWMKNGFHEDGLGSAVEVVERLGARDPLGAAAA